MSSDQPIFILNQASTFDLAVTSNGPAVDVKNAKYFSLQPVSSGSLLGSVQLQGSQDGITWGNVGSSINLASANGIPVNLGTLALPFLRVAFTAAAGTGALNVYIAGKV